MPDNGTQQVIQTYKPSRDLVLQEGERISLSDYTYQVRPHTFKTILQSQYISINLRPLKCFLFPPNRENHWNFKT